MIYVKGKLYSISGEELNKLLGKAYDLGYQQCADDIESEEVTFSFEEEEEWDPTLNN